MKPLDVSRGAAFGDIDSDARVDILLANNNGPARLLRNESTAGNWLSIDAGEPGAWIGVFPAGAPPLWRRSRTDSSYLSASDPRVHAGLGGASRVEKIVVERPDGVRQEEPGPPVNTFVRIRRPRR